MPAQSNPTLDPKLKEAYDRVMGTTIPPSAQPKVIPSQPATPAVVQPPEVKPIQPLSPLPPAQPQIPVQKPLQPLDAAAVPSTENHGSSLLPIVFIIVGFIFFVAYSIFWIKFFNVKVPFLPF